MSDGDSRIPAINTFPGSIFYSKEKSGDWADIPLAKKKVRLIAPEDPFLLTEMPRMVFDDEWFPNVNASHDGKSSPELSTSDLHNIAHSHVGKDEIVLAASLWYPWGYREGTIYTEVSKIDIPVITYFMDRKKIIRIKIRQLKIRPDSMVRKRQQRDKLNKGEKDGGE